MNKSIVRTCFLLFLTVLMLSLMGCAPKRVHKQIATKEKKATHRPLVRLNPIKEPSADDPSKTIEYYANLKQKKRRIVRRSASIPKAAPSAPSAPSKVNLGAAIAAKEKIQITTHYQARLAPGWESNGLKYLSIDGLQYSLREILAYSRRSGSSSPFSLHDGKVLLINLSKSFQLELAFYPPKTKGHEKFKEFDLHLYDKKGTVVHKEYVNKRLQIYTIEK